MWSLKPVVYSLYSGMIKDVKVRVRTHTHTHTHTHTAVKYELITSCSPIIDIFFLKIFARWIPILEGSYMTKVSNEDFTVSIDFERVFARWKGFTNAYMWIILILPFIISIFWILGCQQYLMDLQQSFW